MSLMAQSLDFMHKTALVITSIANDQHPVLKQYAAASIQRRLPFIVIGDTKSPSLFELEGCDFYSIDRQQSLGLSLADNLPTRHYARKNLGYLVAIKNGAEIIVETDDDNIPLDSFWNIRTKTKLTEVVADSGWVNVYKYFSEEHIWPRGFALEKILEAPPNLGNISKTPCPIQQGLADNNPDVDAIYRLTLPLPFTFTANEDVALGAGSICPFNSQNTTWFKEAFALLYLPSYCSFRMTDIWRSFIAQRIAWTCGWSILFHQSTVRQERNDHNLMKDFDDEIVGYQNNFRIMAELLKLDLPNGVANVPQNLIRCYEKLIELRLLGSEEMPLLHAWLSDLKNVS
jgi:hypothetical protein